jgi:hypothetical protein
MQMHIKELKLKFQTVKNMILSRYRYRPITIPLPCQASVNLRPSPFITLTVRHR